MGEINIIQEMEIAQTELEQAAILNEARSILNAEHKVEQHISRRITSAEKSHTSRSKLPRIIEPSKVFSAQVVERICTKYRLRFLDSELFKGEIPAEAVREVKRIEYLGGFSFSRFKIMAPEERFMLKDSTKDPILLAQLPNGKYYFIFQWGEDLKWHQALLKYPFRHMGTLGLTASSIGLIVATVVPAQFQASYAEFFYRFFMFSLTTCLVMTLTIITAIIYAKDFSENIWNSKFNR